MGKKKSKKVKNDFDYDAWFELNCDSCIKSGLNSESGCDRERHVMDGYIGETDVGLEFLGCPQCELRKAMS